jgi:hypothetical protein
LFTFFVRSQEDHPAQERHWLLLPGERTKSKANNSDAFVRSLARMGSVYANDSFRRRQT